MPAMKGIQKIKFILILACLLFAISPPTAGFQIRLNGSEWSCSGRVEISFNGTWGTVCGDGWDLQDAEVVCRELNCGKALRAPGRAFFGQGEGPIWLDDVDCSGGERSLAECNHRGFGKYYCHHGEDAGVICSDVQFRLAGSGSKCSGRVEMFFDRTWGTVCDDRWYLQNAEVVCRELNCGNALQAPGGAFFGQGEGPIWLDDVVCSGGERSLTECLHRGFGKHNCDHGEDAGVTCSGFQIRLTGSKSRCSGRVEIFYNSELGTVCDDGWGLQDAEVVCRELNCGKALAAPRGSSFGRGEGPIWLDDVGCSGRERSLSKCRHKGFGKHNCDHRKDAGVICSGVQIRLNGSEWSCSGRVEIFMKNTWSTVYDNRWDLQDAEVVCRELNCGKALRAPGGSYFGKGEDPIRLDDMDCLGNESSLTECSQRKTRTNYNGFRGNAGVICSGLQIRLNGSESRCSGRVEIFFNGTWGTVCDDGWDLQDAEVVCRELNCGKVLAAPRGSSFGRGEGPIWLDDVGCSGSERSLTECRNGGFGKHNCDHSKDAGVICSAFQIRLAGSESNCSGRVEVFSKGSWGTVCDNRWDLRDAEVVCRELNCGKALEAPGRAFFGRGEGQIWLDGVGCSGSEKSLTECSHRKFGTYNCYHGEDAGVICSDFQIRLNGSESRCSGRVEISFNGTWGTVCDDGWDLQDAAVVCRKLVCGEALAATTGSSFGRGEGPIWLDDVGCSGGEKSLTECRHGGFGKHNCDHSKDAGVICSGFQIRLAGSESNCSGRVEIFMKSTWGTVCDDGWDMQDAEVVCREVNCGKALQVPRGFSFGQGEGPVWLDDVGCSGNERSLTECNQREFGKHNCGHGKDAGVICSGLQIRLNGSESRCTGRVEISFNGTWGTVCDDGWDLQDAEVVCRKLVCGEALAATTGSSFGRGEGPIWLDDVGCSGGEKSLTECYHRGFGKHNCDHSKDAGVICSGFQIRLNGSESNCSGRVEIFMKGSWGTVCDDGWDLQDAGVVCSELNCGKALRAPGGSSFGRGEGPIWLDDVGCSGSERSLAECWHRGFGKHNCGHGEDAGVNCSGSGTSLTDCSHNGFGTHNCEDADVSVSPSMLVYEITRTLLFLIMVSVVVFVTCKTKRQAKQRVTVRVKYQSNNEEGNSVNMVQVDTDQNLEE